MDCGLISVKCVKSYGIMVEDVAMGLVNKMRTR